MFVEKKNKDGIWEAVKGPNPQIANLMMYARWAEERGDKEKAKRHIKEAEEIASGLAYEKTYRDYNQPEVFEGWLYDGRNYSLFAILADVRNGHGFAGIQTGEGFNPIAMPRDIPKDCSPEVAEYFEDGWTHSDSYLYLKELINYDWNQSTTHYGLVSENIYAEWRENKGFPKSYSGDVGGGGIVKITNEEMDEIIDGYRKKEEGKQYFTRVAWHSSYKNSAGGFYEECISKLAGLSETDDYSDVRIVFGFDS